MPKEEFVSSWTIGIAQDLGHRVADTTAHLPTAEQHVFSQDEAQAIADEFDLYMSPIILSGADLARIEKDKEQ